jgi:hypothetical protein
MKYYTSSKTVADSAGIKWVDVFTQGQTAGITSLYDDIHPNNRGHAKAAQVLFDSISSFIRAGNETLINTDTALFRNVRVQSKVLPDSSYWLMGLRGKDGLAFPIEPQRFARLDSNSLSLIANSQINSLWNYGNLTVTGSLQPGGGLMARGSSNYGAGAGAHFDYQGSDVVIDAFNATGGTHGKIKMPFGKLILQAPADVNVFTTALYGRGTGYFTSMYVSGDSALANSTDSAVVLKLGGGKNWGGMTSYKVNAGGTSYFPTVINFSGNAPTLFNTKMDNGLTNNGIQVAGPSFLADTVMLNNVPDGTTSDSLAALKQLSPGKFVIHKIAQSSLGGASNPFADNTALVKNNADNTKLWKVSAASITTGTTRTWTVPDYDGTFAVTDHTQTFSQKQTYSVANRFNGLSNPSNLAYKIAVIDTTTGDMYWVSPSSPINVYDLGSGGSQQRANMNGDSLYVRTSYTNGHADDTLADGGINHVTGNVFNQTADGSVTNTNTTTSILGTGQGSRTIATGKLYVGQTIVVKGFGYISTDATTPTLTITFANSSSNSGNAVNSLLSSSMNNVPIEWEYSGTVRTTGSSGSIQLNGWVSIGGTKAYLASSAASTFNTTTNQTFDVTALFNNASTNNTVTTKQCTVSIN